jgi:hypothetical protein
MAVGENPPSGVILDYSLKDASKDAIKLQILDSEGKVIRKYSSKKVDEQRPPSEGEPFDFGGRDTLPAEKGLNRFVWDLRYEPATKVPGLVVWGGSGAGPVAVPGKYQAKLTVAGKDYAVPFELKEDPRVQTPAADLQKQLELGLKVRDRLSEAHKAVNEMKEAQAQMTALKTRLGSDEKVKDIVAAMDDLNKKIGAVEDGLVQLKAKAGEDALNFPNGPADQLQALGSTVDSSDNAPTQQSYAVFDKLTVPIGEQLAKWQELKDKDLPAVNDKISKANIPAIALTPPKEE